MKPKNIFLDKNLNIKVGDLGLSKEQINEMSYGNTTVGTVGYQSPEMNEKYPYDKMKCDVWAVGCLIYEMCMQMMWTLREEDISQYYSQDLENLSKWMLTRKFEDRPSVDEIL
jgi:serine/threonine protein kinase